MINHNGKEYDYTETKVTRKNLIGKKCLFVNAAQSGQGCLGFPGGSAVTNLTASAGDARDVGSVPESGRSPGVGNALHSTILAWKILWAVEPDGLQSMGLQIIGHD